MTCTRSEWVGADGRCDGEERQAVHEELHKRIKRLAQTGTLVCLCSRNQPALVHEAFQELEPRGLQLKLGQDILRTMVGVSAGGSKADSLRRLAQELNLSLSAFAVSLCLLVVETVQASVMVPANLLAAHISWSEACCVQLDAPGMLACMLSRCALACILSRCALRSMAAGRRQSRRMCSRALGGERATGCT